MTLDITLNLSLTTHAEAYATEPKLLLSFSIVQNISVNRRCVDKKLDTTSITLENIALTESLPVIALEWRGLWSHTDWQN